jgi:hypothetical protein
VKLLPFKPGQAPLDCLLLSSVVRNHDPFEIVGVTTFTYFSLSMAVLHAARLLFLFFVLVSIFFYIYSSTYITHFRRVQKIANSGC